MEPLPVWSDIDYQVFVSAEEHSPTVAQMVGTKRGRTSNGHITLNLNENTANEDEIDWSVYADRVEDSEFLQELLTISEKSSIGCMDAERAGIIPVTRAYEEQFLCEPDDSQRRCCRMSACEGLKLVDNGVGGFVLREFILPNTTAETNTNTNTPAMCLLCTRKAISRSYFSMLSGERSCKPNCIISRITT